MQLTLPIYHTISRPRAGDKTIYLALNWYRNAYHYEQNSVKTAYHSVVASQLPTPVTTFTTFHIHYQLFYKTATSDPSNCISIIEKFLLDALQEHLVIPNDNVVHHRSSSWEVISQDRDNPRIVATITPA